MSVCLCKLLFTVQCDLRRPQPFTGHYYICLCPAGASCMNDAQIASDMHVTLSGDHHSFLLAAGDICWHMYLADKRCHSKTTSNFNCGTFGLSNVSKCLELFSMRMYTVISLQLIGI